jgi:peptidoglycan/xylan/chitin deacetylase (PgdA/CDA1 family)
MIISNGHEVGSHGYSHNPDNAFDVLSLKEQINHLNKSKKLLEDLSGQEVISFRAPALRVNKNTSIALNHTGFKIDSSIASQRFDFFLSLGGLKKMKWLTAPRLPYRTDINNLFRKGSSEIIEVPISATLLPYIGTTMRIFPGITKIQRKILNTENKLNHKPIVFLIHPNEIIDESNEKHFIMRRSNNLISYLIRDLLRSKMKIKNLGINALVLYEREISYFIKNQYSFSTLKGYCSTNKLI